MHVSAVSSEYSQTPSQARFRGVILARMPVDLRDNISFNLVGRRTGRNRTIETFERFLRSGTASAAGYLQDARQANQTAANRSEVQPRLAKATAQFNRYQHLAQIRGELPNGPGYIRIIVPTDGKTAGYGKPMTSTSGKRELYLLEANGSHSNDLTSRLAQAVTGHTDTRALASAHKYLTGCSPIATPVSKAHLEDFRHALRPGVLSSILGDYQTLFTTPRSIEQVKAAVRPKYGTDPTGCFKQAWGALMVEPTETQRIFAPIFAEVV